MIFYAFDNRGLKYHSSISSTGTEYARKWTRHSSFDKQKNSLIIKMELNVIDKTLCYYVNDEYQQIAFDKIDFDNHTYTMAACLYSKNDQVELINFKQTKQKKIILK